MPNYAKRIRDDTVGILLMERKIADLAMAAYRKWIPLVADQVLPFHRAAPLAGVVPTRVKLPDMYTLPAPSAAILKGSASAASRWCSATLTTTTSPATRCTPAPSQTRVRAMRSYTGSTRRCATRCPRRGRTT